LAECTCTDAGGAGVGTGECAGKCAGDESGITGDTITGEGPIRAAARQSRAAAGFFAVAGGAAGAFS
jgi:hypothetical protein